MIKCNFFSSLSKAVQVYIKTLVPYKDKLLAQQGLLLNTTFSLHEQDLCQPLGHSTVKCKVLPTIFTLVQPFSL
jgi:hypothetical protein